MTAAASDRTVFSITGDDRLKFLQGLVTNDVTGAKNGLVYAALLTPQGKFLADFFLADRGDAILLDAPAELAPDLFRRLSMYKLRADVAITATELKVQRGLGVAPDGAMPDPRHPDLGWRRYGQTADDGGVDWDALRVKLGVPALGSELFPDQSYILEQGFERLHGVDFKKGCYVGQEVTARMKHKTELRKGLARVRVDGTATPGEEILADGKPVGTLGTVAGDHALAYLRFDRATGPMTAGTATITLDE